MSAPDLLIRATQFFLLTEQISGLGYWSHRLFWEMSPPLVQNRVACLPAMTAAIKQEQHGVIPGGILHKLLHQPLPGVFPLEAVPWHDRLVGAWEVHYASDNPRRQNAARLALVRLDGCGLPDGMQRPSRLPEWLAEARRIVGAGCEPARTEPARTGQWRVVSGKRRTEKLGALAALAAWQPAPGVVTSPETLREWVDLWQEVRSFTNPLLKGIAAKALLNLPEADLRAASIPTVPLGQLLHELARAIPVATGRTIRDGACDYLLMLDWQPAEVTSWPAIEVKKVAQAWLKVTQHASPWVRRTAWQQLVNREWREALDACRIDLFSFLVSAVKEEAHGLVLWEMARWKPDGGTSTKIRTGSLRARFRELETHWQWHRRSDSWLSRGAAWLGGMHLREAGVASEAPMALMEAYLSAVAQEPEVDVLSVLAQWVPGPDAPPAVHREWQQVWQRRLKDGPKYLRKVAALALLHQALEKGEGEQLRRLALEVWRAGTEGATEAAHPFISVASRFQEVQAHLAAGTVPDFRDEGKLPSPAQRQYPRLALPPGHIADREWKMENGELKMENERLKMENHEVTLAPGNRPAPDGPSR